LFEWSLEWSFEWSLELRRGELVMLWPVLFAAFALGAAAMPHCALMCGAPCAALTARAQQHAVLFHAGRVLGYSAAGAVAAGSIGSLGLWLQASPALRPLWTLLHLAFLFLALWWLLTGRQPAWLLRRGGATLPQPMRWQGAQPAPKTWRSGAAGLAWVAWPCAAVQGALLLAALADGAVAGALVMAVFALASLPGLLVAPWAWARWQAWRGQAAARGEVAALGFRLAGLGVLMVSGWALTQGVWQRAAAWCGL
jgi:uncharacterized protein